MKSTDLRIGNYVKLFLNHEDYDVIQIRIDDLYYINQKNGIYEPIPLTEEWLEKFGLKPNEWFCEGSFAIVEDNDFEKHYGWCMKVRNASHNKEIEFSYYKYVHQLQNLYFALTEQELEIKT